MAFVLMFIVTKFLASIADLHTISVLLDSPQSQPQHQPKGSGQGLTKVESSQRDARECIKSSQQTRNEMPVSKGAKAGLQLDQ